MRRAASMENDKTRILVRFRPEISECFELQAIYEGLRVGTIANRVLREEIEKVLEGADLIFVTIGAGGGTGSGAGHVVAEIARGLGILVIGKWR